MIDPPITPERSSLMARVGPKDTKPELIVRKILHSLGFRFRLQARELPGSPDIVFRPKRKVIFVHGCFWHRHPGCRRATIPKTRREFWEIKFAANQARDKRVEEELTSLGWSFLVIWECETGNHDALSENVKTFLDEAN